MFLRQLTALAFAPRGHPAVVGALGGVNLPAASRAWPHPPPSRRHPHSHPHHHLSAPVHPPGRGLLPTPQGFLCNGLGPRSVHVSSGRMERSDREPPNKRGRSDEEGRSRKERMHSAEAKKGGEERGKNADSKGGEERRKRAGSKGGEEQGKRADSKGGEEQGRRGDSKGGEEQGRRGDSKGGEEQGKRGDSKGGEERRKSADSKWSVKEKRDGEERRKSADSKWSVKEKRDGEERRSGNETWYKKEKRRGEEKNGEKWRVSKERERSGEARESGTQWREEKWRKGKEEERIGGPGHPGERAKPLPRNEVPHGASSTVTTSPSSRPSHRVLNGDGEPSPSDQRLQEHRNKRLHREWDYSPQCSTPLSPQGGIGRRFDFSVLCYNILSQVLLQDNAYLYRHCNPQVLTWEQRLSGLLREISHHNADVLCLQEVQEDHYNSQIKPALESLGYQCEFKRRTGDKPDGCAVVFKMQRFSLVSSHPIEYLRPHVSLLDRDNVALILLLRPNHADSESDPSACLCVANTHLLYNPRRGDIKLAQLAMLLAEVKRLSRLSDGSAYPVVMCGDFNSTPWSPLYSFLTQGSLEYHSLTIGKVSGQEESGRGGRVLNVPIWPESLGINQQCQYQPTVEGAISSLRVQDSPDTDPPQQDKPSVHSSIEHGLKLRSVYNHVLKHDGKPEITTCHSNSAITVDYILFTADTPPPEGDSTSDDQPPSLPGGRGLELLGRLSLVSYADLKEVNLLPNQNHSSDHLPLIASFRLYC